LIRQMDPELGDYIMSFFTQGQKCTMLPALFWV
jgi:hypothetical protein